MTNERAQSFFCLLSTCEICEVPSRWLKSMTNGMGFPLRLSDVMSSVSVSESVFDLMVGGMELKQVSFSSSECI